MYVSVRGRSSLSEAGNACPATSNAFICIRYFAIAVFVFLLARRCAGDAGAPSSVRCSLLKKALMIAGRGTLTARERMNAITTGHERLYSDIEIQSPQP